MVSQVNQKVTQEHLQRRAYLYIRQSSLRQVRVHQESGRRQYALQQRAIELGWPKGRIVIIDNDQGQSAAPATDREGFRRLVAEVGMRKAGIILGLEVSRLARNNSDWHQLLEICGLSQTLILDEDGLYDPCNFNDRLLLGLKGAMSEAELHILKSRMRGGVLSKAQRGALHLHLPVGFVYDDEGKVVLDPDKQVQQSIRLLFQTYRRVGSARRVVVCFHQQGLLFPRHPHGQIKEKLEWKKLYSSLVRDILHNPVYAGAFVYGRSREIRRPDGTTGRLSVPREQWKVLIKDVHEGYISWEEYEKNQKQLQYWTQAKGGTNKRQGPPREGCALLQGLVICGICGKRMTVHYHKRAGRPIPSYVCTMEQREWGGSRCQGVMGEGADKAVGNLLMESVTPLNLEVALNVQKELQQRFDETDKIRRQQVERAQYETNLAKRRYMQVDPDNRLVVGTLETNWNEKLCALEKAKEEYERLRQDDQMTMNDKKREEIISLATDFPRLWQNPNVPDRERKRMMRLLIEDVTLLVGKDVTPKPCHESMQTKPEIVKTIDCLLDHYMGREVAAKLNQQGFRSGGHGLPFNVQMVGAIQRKYGLKSRYDRFRERGMLKVEEVAKKLNVASGTVRRWQKEGLLKRYEYTKGKFLFESPGNRDYKKCKHFKNRMMLLNENSQRNNQEVQYEQ